MSKETGLEALGLTEKEEQKRFKVKEQLTDIQRDVLVHWQMFPHLTNTEIAEDLGVGQGTVSRTIKKYGWVYEEDMEEGMSRKEHEGLYWRNN